MQNSVSAIFAERSAPSISEESNSSGAVTAIISIDAKKITVKITFINYVYERRANKILILVHRWHKISFTAFLIVF